MIPLDRVGDYSDASCWWNYCCGRGQIRQQYLEGTCDVHCNHLVRHRLAFSVQLRRDWDFPRLCGTRSSGDLPLCLPDEPKFAPKNVLLVMEHYDTVTDESANPLGKIAGTS
jgi:hypothetical protein